MRLNTDLVSWREVENDVVVLDERTWKYVHLNSSASVLWLALAGGAARDDLIARLSEQFSGDGVDFEADVDAFLGDLRARGYLDES